MTRIAMIGTDAWTALALQRIIDAEPELEFVGAFESESDLATGADRIVTGGADVVIFADGHDAAARRIAEGVCGSGRFVVHLARGPRHPSCPEEGNHCTVQYEDGPFALLEVLRVIHRGDRPVSSLPAHGRRNPARLSTQELRVMVLTARGESAIAVAAALGISAGTVAAYLRRIRTKYRSIGRPAPTKLHLHLRATEDGILDD